MKESYGSEEYKFEVKGIYVYPASVSVFMSLDGWRHVFEKEETYFNGYLSDERIEEMLPPSLW